MFARYCPFPDKHIQLFYDLKPVSNQNKYKHKTLMQQYFENL